MEARNNSFREIWKALKKSKNVLISLHPRPDGDSLGSATAMKYVLEKRGIKVRLVSKDRISENLEFYDFNKEVEYGVSLEDVNLEEFDWILFVDWGNLYDLSDEFLERLKTKKTINMDHHQTNQFFGTLNYVNPLSPSACSIVYEFAEKIHFKFDREFSLRLMVGICTDTAFFIHGNSLDSLRKAEILLDRGKIDYNKELVIPITDLPWNLKKYHSILLSNMERKEINGQIIGYSWATKKELKKLGLNPTDLRLGIMCMQNIKDLNLIFTLTEKDKEIGCSFRSRGLDTTIYSTIFGGGGHKQASAFSLKPMNMKKAIELVLKTIKEKGFVEIENNSDSTEN
ncbi:MAG TPA: DHH family phosphoesterase [Patescibacteria group bacterium]|nr:DHH family phosphoesterase [Patescibacteria group bacterium]